MTVLSRTVVTTRSMLSTASVVQSLMAPRSVREPGERTRRWPDDSGQVEDRDGLAGPRGEQHERGAVAPRREDQHEHRPAPMGTGRVRGGCGAPSEGSLETAGRRGP